MNEERPHQNRRQHQEALRRRQKRRQARSRRLRAVLGFRFWTRAAIAVFLLLCTVFWARFALVYDIPGNVTLTNLSNMTAYVTVKPWWFGPPAFDLAQTQAAHTAPYLSAKDALLEGLGRYRAVVLQPSYVWVMKK